MMKIPKCLAAFQSETPSARPETAKAREERERKGVPLLWLRGAASGPGLFGGGFRQGLSSGLRLIGQGRWLAGGIHLATTVTSSRLATAVVLGLGLAASTAALVALAEHFAPAHAKRGNPFASSAPARPGASSSSLSNEGLLGSIPGVYRWSAPSEAGAPETGASSGEGTGEAANGQGKTEEGKAAGDPEGGGPDAAAIAAAMERQLAGQFGAGHAGAARAGRLERMSLPPPAGSSALSLAGKPSEPGAVRDAARSLPEHAKNPAATAARRKRAGLRSIGARHMPAQSRSAMDQLRFATAMSESARPAGGSERGAQYAAAAFEQQAPAGGAALPAPIGGAAPSSSGGVGPSSGGAGASSGGPIESPTSPDISDIPETKVPDPGPTKDVTPYQQELDEARGLTQKAKELKSNGTIMIALGAAMIAAGIALLAIWGSWAAGIALIVSGGAAVYLGMSMVSQATSAAKQAKALADKIGQQWEQAAQAAKLKACTGRALDGKDCDDLSTRCGYKPKMTNEGIRAYAKCMANIAVEPPEDGG